MYYEVYEVIISTDKQFVAEGSSLEHILLTDTVYKALKFEYFGDKTMGFLRKAREVHAPRKFKVVTVPKDIF